MKNEKFKDVYQRYGKLIMQIGLDRCEDLNVAEEICQQTFENYYVNMEDIQEALIKPWLIQEAKDAANNHVRKEKIRNKKYKKLYAKKRFKAKESTVEEEPDSQLLEVDILEDLKRKNKMWFEVIEAVCVFGMDQDQAVKYLRIPPRVLRSKLYGARLYIRKQYGGSQYEEQERMFWN